MRFLSQFLMLLVIQSSSLFGQSMLQGAWKSDDGVLIIAAGYFSFASFDADSFEGTYGGTFHSYEDQTAITYEFNTMDPTLVGQITLYKMEANQDQLSWGDQVMTRIDDGTPGDLAGPWIISGRMRNGEMHTRTAGARKTMKILSGTRFQWIAYNTETGKFSGSGGGTYTTDHGHYVETIDFFSRDQQRVGASLPFDYEIDQGAWHHMGQSSSGDPIHEIWIQRQGDH